MAHTSNRITSWINSGAYKIIKRKNGNFELKVEQTAEFIIDKEQKTNIRYSDNPRHFGDYELTLTIPFIEVVRNHK